MILDESFRKLWKEFIKLKKPIMRIIGKGESLETFKKAYNDLTYKIDAARTDYTRIPELGNRIDTFMQIIKDIYTKITYKFESIAQTFEWVMKYTLLDQFQQSYNTLLEQYCTIRDYLVLDNCRNFLIRHRNTIILDILNRVKYFQNNLPYVQDKDLLDFIRQIKFILTYEQRRMMSKKDESTQLDMIEKIFKDTQEIISFEDIINELNVVFLEGKLPKGDIAYYCKYCKNLRGVLGQKK